MYIISVDCTFAILAFFSKNMKSVKIIFSVLLNFMIYQQSVSNPILFHSNSVSKVFNDIGRIQYYDYEKKDRIKRQYFDGPHLGPISFDSADYESDTPPPGYEESAEKSVGDPYHYSKPDTTTALQSISRVSYKFHHNIF